MALDDTASNQPDTNKPKNSGGLAKRLVPLGVIVALLLVGYFSGVHTYLSLDTLSENKAALDAFVQDNFVLAMGSYLIIYIVAVSISFPGASFLTIAGGAIFGWLIGGTLTIFGATIGASIIFLVAKTSLGDFLAEKAGPRMSKLRDGFQKDAFNYLLTLRLAPVVPFWITNLAPAFFGMDLGRYALATFLGIIPGTYAYSFIGEQVGTSFEKDSNIVTNVTLGLAALAIASVVPLIVKYIRNRKNRSATDTSA
ncbi:MAG: TVP38/TMEM64 family protein [Hyphomicrobiales bacterium]